FVRIRNSGEVRQLAGERSSVQSLNVSFDQSVQLRMDVHLDKGHAIFGCEIANFLSGLPVRGNRRGNRNHSITRQEARDVSDPPNVRVPILLRKAESLRQVSAHFIAIQQLQWNAWRKPRLKGGRQRTLAGSGKTGEPQHESPRRMQSSARSAWGCGARPGARLDPILASTTEGAHRRGVMSVPRRGMSIRRRDPSPI